MLDSGLSELKGFQTVTLGQKIALNITPEKCIIIKITAATPEDINLIAEDIAKNRIITEVSPVLSCDKANSESDVYAYLHVLPICRRR